MKPETINLKAETQIQRQAGSVKTLTSAEAVEAHAVLREGLLALYRALWEGMCPNPETLIPKL